MNILIVDDEQVIVEGIRLLVVQSMYNFSNVYVAYGGEEALKILRENRVDILLCDIKMPVMDGFELIANVRQMENIPEIVMITGFAEFEYVQRALNYGTVGYILKPIDEMQFASVLNKAVNNVLKKRSAAKTQAEYADLEDKVLRLNVERTLNIIFSGGIIGKQEQKILDEVFYKDNNKFFQLVTFHINVKHNEMIDTTLLLEDIKKELLLHFDKEGKTEQFYLMRTSTGRGLHCLCAGPDEMEGLEDTFRRFYNNYNSFVPMEMYISMSDVRRKISRELYTHSQEAYYERFLNEGKCILRYRARDNIHKVSIIENELKLLELQICNGEMAEFRSVLAKVFTVQYIKDSKLTVRAVYFLVCNTVIMTFHKMHMEIPNVVVDELLSENALSSMERIDELAEYIYNIVFDMMMEHENFNLGTNLTIKKIVNYVNVNFHEDLSLKSLSASFGLTPNYLSQIFKNETGESFVSYLNRLRIERACVLLKTSSVKISEIVRQVGYNDSQYFYRVFKKYVGQTPIEYRMSKQTLT